MARKKIEKAHWTPDETLRPLTYHMNEDDDHLNRERVTLTLDDAGLRKLQHEIVAVREALAPLRDQLDQIKRQMKEKQGREQLLVEAMVAGTLTEWREVYAYANDAEQIVFLYDAHTKELLGERVLSHHERQMEFDYGPTKVREFDPENPECPSGRWHDFVRNEELDEDGKQAYVCDNGCGRLMWDPEKNEGLFYEEDDEADDDQESDDDAAGDDE